MSKRNNLLHCVKCSDNRHPLASSGKSTKHAPLKAPPKQLNIQTLEQPNSQTHSNIQTLSCCRLKRKTENGERDDKQNEQCRQAKGPTTGGAEINGLKL